MSKAPAKTTSPENADHSIASISKQITVDLEQPSASKSPAIKRTKVNDTTAQQQASNGASKKPKRERHVVKQGLTNQCKLEGIPAWKQINDIFASEKSTEDFLLESGIVETLTSCPRPNCGKPLCPPRQQTWRCRGCEKIYGREFRKSMYHGSFFGFFRLKKSDILVFLYHWLTGAKTRQLLIITGWSTQTLGTYIKAVQELIATELVAYDDRQQQQRGDDAVRRHTATIRTTKDNQIANTKTLGGMNVRVQLAAMSFGKRSYRPQINKFRPPGCWLFCAMEVTPTHKFVCLLVPDRNPSTLTNMLKQYIGLGSILRCDSNWTGMAGVLNLKKEYDYVMQKSECIEISPHHGDNGDMNTMDQRSILHMNHQQQQQQQQQRQQQRQQHAADAVNDPRMWPNLYLESQGTGWAMSHNSTRNGDGDGGNANIGFYATELNPETTANVSTPVNYNYMNKNLDPLAPNLNINNNNNNLSTIDLATNTSTAIFPTLREPLTPAASTESNNDSAPNVTIALQGGGGCVLIGTKRSADTPQSRYNNISEIQGCLFEYIWRARHKGNLWKGLLQCLADVQYEMECKGL